MHRRLRTLLAIMSAVTLVLAIGIPTATAGNRRSGPVTGTTGTGRIPAGATTSRGHATHAGTAGTTRPTTTQPQPDPTDADEHRRDDGRDQPPENPSPLPPPAGTSAKPAAGGYFSILPPGSALPSGAACAARVHRSTWEPRPENTTANHTAPTQPGCARELLAVVERVELDATSRASTATSRAPRTRSSSGPRASGA